MSKTTIINDDCLTALKQMADNSLDAIITDPPYNIKMDDWDAFPDNFAFQEWMFEIAKECFRVVRPGGSVAAFAAARTYQHTAVAFERAGFAIRDMVEWVYWSGMPKGKNLKACHEPIMLAMKPDKNNGLTNYTFNIDACRIPVKEKKKKGTDAKVVEINNLKFEVEKQNELVEF